MTKLEILKYRQFQTEVEILDLLTSRGKCALIRPTGFGKTVIMAKIAQDPEYKRVLYVYPSEAVRGQAIEWLNNKNIDWITYYSFGKLSSKGRAKQLIEIAKNYDLIIFDEFHHMGSENVIQSMDVLLSNIDLNRTHILGGTATPKRMDNVNTIDKFFDNCVITGYSLNDAIEDGLIPNPYYVYSLENYEVLLGDRYLKAVENKLQDTVIRPDTLNNKIETLRDKAGQLSYYMNAPNIIKRAVIESSNNVIPTYMRFMIFTSSVEILNHKKPEIETWFRVAFPEHKVRTLVIHSRGLDERENLEQLPNLGNPDKTIDLILSINMLNEGYHLGTITGCVLLRPTKSSVVYTQQIGRCLKIGMDNTPIIIDFVDNLNTLALFNKSKQEDSGNKQAESDESSNVMYIDKKNIRIVDEIAKVDSIRKKFADSIIGKGARIIQYRIDWKAPASQLAAEFRVPVYKVVELLLKYDDTLKPLGLHLQDIDRYNKGIPDIGEIGDVTNKLNGGNT